VWVVWVWACVFRAVVKGCAWCGTDACLPTPRGVPPTARRHKPKKKGRSRVGKAAQVWEATRFTTLGGVRPPPSLPLPGTVAPSGTDRRDPSLGSVISNLPDDRHRPAKRANACTRSQKHMHQKARQLAIPRSALAPFAKRKRKREERTAQHLDVLPPYCHSAERAHRRHSRPPV
jgi:hypothetical protein